MRSALESGLEEYQKGKSVSVVESGEFTCFSSKESGEKGKPKFRLRNGKSDQVLLQGPWVCPHVHSSRLLFIVSFSSLGQSARGYSNASSLTSLLEPGVTPFGAAKKLGEQRISEIGAPPDAIVIRVMCVTPPLSFVDLRLPQKKERV